MEEESNCDDYDDVVDDGLVVIDDLYEAVDGDIV